MIAIRAERLITDPSNEVVVDGVVVVNREGRVAAAGSAHEVSIPPDASVLQFRGTVIPGLVDMHVHVQKIGADEFGLGEHSPRPLTELAVRGVNNLAAAIRGGITTVRDLGAPSDGIFSLARAVAAGGITGPRIIASGRAPTLVEPVDVIEGGELDIVEAAPGAVLANQLRLVETVE